MSLNTRRCVEHKIRSLINSRLRERTTGLSAGALGAMALSGPVFAADTTPADTSGAADQQLQEIVVTGIRASLQKSLDIKEQSVGVVDAISAEDIGAFPDARIPVTTISCN